MTFFPRQNKDGRRGSKETEGASTEKTSENQTEARAESGTAFYWKERTGRHTNQRRVLASLLQSEPEVITAYDSRERLA